MRLDSKALAIAAALLWGGGILFLGVVQMASAGYGSGFSEAIASIYPGYSADGSVGDLLIGGAWGFADGAVGGLIFAWLYNRLAAARG